MVNHSSIFDGFSKLNPPPVNSYILNWYLSFLTERSHFTIHNGVSSSTLQTNTGVPQGTISGPILFDIAVDDTYDNAHLILRAKLTAYADDKTPANPGKYSLPDDSASVLNNLEQHFASKNLF